MASERPRSKGLKPLRWFSKHFGHRTVDFVLACPDLTSELRGCLGYAKETDDGRITVWIDATTPRDVQDVTVLHESLHVAAWDAKLDAGDEEAAFSAAEPVWPMLVLCGLKWPRRPKGAAALEAYARKRGK